MLSKKKEVQYVTFDKHDCLKNLRPLSKSKNINYAVRAARKKGCHYPIIIAIDFKKSPEAKASGGSTAY